MALSTWLTAVGLAVFGVAAVLAVAAVFYVVGRSEDRERERDRERGRGPGRPPG